MRLGRLKVRERIYAGFAATTAIGVAVAVFGVFQLASIDFQVGQMKSVTANMARVQQVMNDLEAMRRGELRFRMDADEASLTELRERASNIAPALAAAGSTSLSAERRRTYEGLQDELRAHVDMSAQFVQLVRTAQAERAKLFSGGDQLTAATSKLIETVTTTEGVDNALAERLNGAVLLVRVANWRFMATGDKNGPATFKTTFDRASAALAQFEHVATPAEQPMIPPVRNFLAAYAAAFAAYSDAQLKAVEMFDTTLRPQVLDMQGKLAELSHLQSETWTRTTSQTSQILSNTSLLQEVLAGVSILLGIALAMLIGRGIVRPLSRMTGAMQRLAAGDTTVDVPARDNTDEIGDMARAVEVFKQNAIAADGLAATQAAEQAAKEQRVARIDALVSSFEAKVGRMVGVLAGASSGLEGTAKSLAATASETNQQATKVAAAAEEASAGVQTVAAAAEELTSSIGEIGRQVVQSAKMTGQAAADARRTDAVVQALAACRSEASVDFSQLGWNRAFRGGDLTCGGKLRRAMLFFSPQGLRQPVGALTCGQNSAL
jgi:HAMP domain-containing protein